MEVILDTTLAKVRCFFFLLLFNICGMLSSGYLFHNSSIILFLFCLYIK